MAEDAGVPGIVRDGSASVVTASTKPMAMSWRQGCGLPPGLGDQEARAMSITLPEERKAWAL